MSSQQTIFIFAGLFVFVIAFLKTNVALVILIFSMLLSPEIGMGNIADRSVTVRAEDIFLIIIFVAWLGKLAVFKELGLMRKTPLNKPILVYVFFCLLSTSLALIEGRVAWQRSLFYFLKYFEYFLLYFLVVNNTSNLKQAKFFVTLFIITCLIVSIYGLFSYQGPGMRATAPFEEGGEPATLSGYLVLLMAIMLSLVLNFRSFKLRVGLVCVLGVSFLTFAFTLSRGGWVSFIFMYFVFILFTKRHKFALVAGLLLIFFIWPMIAPKDVVDRVGTTFARGGKKYTIGRKEFIIDESGAARIDSWKVGLDRIMQRPIFGHGIPTGSVIDNQYTRVMAETGVLGFWAFLYLLRVIYKTIRNTIIAVRGDPWAQSLSIGFLCGFCGLLVHSFSSATFILIRIMEPFWFLMAIIVILPELVKSESSDVSIMGT